MAPRCPAVAELAEKPFAVFGMGPDSLDESKVTESQRQLERSLASVQGLEPIAVTVFGGALRPETWHFPLNHLPAFDARDWDAIRVWAQELAVTFGTPVAA